MAYRRRRAYKKRTMTKSGGWGNTLSKVASVANTALKIGKFVASVVNVEKKYFDVSSTTTPGTSGSIANLSLITTGTASNQRIGSSVKLTSFTLRAFVDVDDTSTTNQSLRVILFQDSANTSVSSPAVTDLLEVTGSANIIVSPYSMNNPGRFHVFYDKVFDLEPIGTGSGRRSLMVTYKPKANPKKKILDHIKWDESGDAQADLRAGAIYMIVCSDQASAIPTLRYYSRLRFIDN